MLVDGDANLRKSKVWSRSMVGFSRSDVRPFIRQESSFSQLRVERATLAKQLERWTSVPNRHPFLQESNHSWAGKGPRIIHRTLKRNAFVPGILTDATIASTSIKHRMFISRKSTRIDHGDRRSTMLPHVTLVSLRFSSLQLISRWRRSPSLPPNCTSFEIRRSGKFDRSIDRREVGPSETEARHREHLRRRRRTYVRRYVVACVGWSTQPTQLFGALTSEPRHSGDSLEVDCAQHHHWDDSSSRVWRRCQTVVKGGIATRGGEGPRNLANSTGRPYPRCALGKMKNGDIFQCHECDIYRQIQR